MKKVLSTLHFVYLTTWPLLFATVTRSLRTRMQSFSRSSFTKEYASSPSEAWRSTSRDGPSAPLSSWIGEEASQDGTTEGDFDRDDRHSDDGTTTDASRLLAVLGPPFARTSRFWWGVFYALVQVGPSTGDGDEL